MISIELKESIGVIGNKIKQAFAEEINTLVKKREKNILSQCKDLVSAWIISPDFLFTAIRWLSSYKILTISIVLFH